MSQKVEEFYGEQRQWNELTQRILKDETVNHMLGLLIKPEDLNDLLANDLLDNGVVYLTVQSTEKCKEIEYQFDWNRTIGTQHLIWTTCDTVQTKQGYYKDAEPIEVLGIGQNWLVWFDIDSF